MATPFHASANMRLAVDAIRRHDPDEADRALQSHLNSVSATWHAFGQTTNKKK